jgi:hypothetical protein
LEINKQTLDKTRQFDLKHIEIYTGQKMGEHFSDVIFDYDLTPEKQEHLKEVATSKDIKIVSSGVWTSSR